MQMHVLPPVPKLMATWTTPFMAPGVALPTLARDAQNAPVALSVVESRGGGVRLQAPGGGAASVQRADVYACKGFVNVVDAPLMPAAW
jgi:hypothetical protein